MRPPDIPSYEEIAEDMGYSRQCDDAAARLLKNVMTDARLAGEDALREAVGEHVVITGGSPFDLSDIADGTLIATGASIPFLLDNGIVPDIIVTDLDGDVEYQKEASRRGSLTVMHAHGDNVDGIMEHARDFPGRVVLTTQTAPDRMIYNFGGFTDGDRAACIAAVFGARTADLLGFDLEEPAGKDGCDAETKRRKLKWAGRILDSLNGRIDIRFL